MPTIPTYAHNRQRCRRYSLASIERLLREGKVIVDRNSRGEITAAMFRPRPEREVKPRCRNTVSTGTYYSHLVTLDERGHQLWQHKDLLTLSEMDVIMGERVDEIEDRDRFLAAIFRAVPLSCLTTPKPRAVVRTAIRLSMGSKQAEQLQRGWKKKTKKIFVAAQ